VGSDIVPDVAAARSQGAVAVVQPFQRRLVETALFGEKASGLFPVFRQVHGQDHRVFKSLGIDGGDLAVASHFVEAGEAERIAPVLFLCQKRPVVGAEQFDEKGLAVSRLPDEDEGHLLAGAPFGGILDKGDKAVDFVKHADGMLATAAEKIEVIGGAAVYHHLFEPCFQYHARH